MLPVLLTQILGFPSFVLGVLILYWSLPLTVLQGRCKFWKLYGKRDDAYGWAKALQALFGIRMLVLPGEQLYKEPCFYLCNHRSWGDFFIDVLTTEGHAQMLSRMAVAFVFPFFMVAVNNIRSVVLFKRGGKFDPQEFNLFIDRKLAGSPVEGLIVYPEGHRSLRKSSLPLKKGMLHYLHSRKMRAQVIITYNKEAVLSEKQLTAHFGQTILVGYSRLINAADHAEPQGFFEEVQRVWDAEWQRVYSADWSEGQPAVNTTPEENRSYPAVMKTMSVVYTSLSCLAFLVTILGSAWATRLLLHLLGTWQIPVASLATVWFLASMVWSLRPVQFPSEPLLKGRNPSHKATDYGTAAGSAQPAHSAPRLRQRLQEPVPEQQADLT